MGRLAILLLAVSAVLAPRQQEAPLTSSARSQIPNRNRGVAVHTLFLADAGAMMWLHGAEDGIELEDIEPLWQPLRLHRHPAPDGDGLWVELLSVKLELIGAYRSAVPAQGERCGIELPVVRGTWWVMLLEHDGKETTILGRFEVGPQLMQLVKEHGIPTI